MTTTVRRTSVYRIHADGTTPEAMLAALPTGLTWAGSGTYTHHDQDGQPATAFVSVRLTSDEQAIDLARHIAAGHPHRIFTGYGAHKREVSA